MSSSSHYIIKKSPRLFRSFPSIRKTTSSQLTQPTWLVYGQYVSEKMLNKLSGFAGVAVVPLMAWQVGRYDVLLIKGELTEKLALGCQMVGIDYAECTSIPNLRSPGLALFDMDSTAIQIECIDEIAKLAGVGEKVSAITERAMQGELDFEQSLRERVAALEGTPEDVLWQVRDTLPYMSGMRPLAESLLRCGWKVAIASGGFTCFSNKVKSDLALTAAFSNQLVIENGKLTGELKGDIVDAQRKADILENLADQYGIPLLNTIAVGDGANDLMMMKKAGLGIAYHAKSKVQQKAQVSIRHADLAGVLCVLSASLLPHSLSWGE